MRTAYFVDGYNVIHSSSLFRGLLRRGAERAQEELARQVMDFCNVGSADAWVVFDAYRRNGRRMVERLGTHVRVVVTGTGETADCFIEESVGRIRGQYEYVYVVTFDYSQVLTVLDEHTLPRSPHLFLQELHRARSQRRQEFQIAAAASSVRLTDYLSSDTVKRLRNMAYRTSR